MTGPLSLENVESQFCSDWLKDEIRRVLKDRDAWKLRSEQLSEHNAQLLGLSDADGDLRSVVAAALILVHDSRCEVGKEKLGGLRARTATTGVTSQSIGGCTWLTGTKSSFQNTSGSTARFLEKSGARWD